MIRRGFYKWSNPIEVRRRLDIIGEEDTVLQGMWVMDDCSGGGLFKGTLRTYARVCILFEGRTLLQNVWSCIIAPGRDCEDEGVA